MKVYTFPDPHNVSRRKLLPIEYVINENGCWIVFKKTNVSTDGYPQIKRHGVRLSIHRYIMQLKNGSIPKGKESMHSCDNRKCINPDHLSIGTHRDNIIDMYSKNRGNKICSRGADHFNAKLTENDVYAILADPRIQREIALDYGVKHNTISYIKSGKNWNHVWRDYHGQKAESGFVLQTH